MPEVHEGGCSCGAVRYRTTNAPRLASVCHCTFCQHRSGSAFGVGVYFKSDDVEFLCGTLRVYEHRSDESDRWIRTEFCVSCGSTVTWTLEAMPDGRGLAGGTFDDPHWFEIDRHGWTRSAHRWVAIPHGVLAYEQSALPPTKTA